MRSIRFLWMAIITIVAVIAGVAGGTLSWLGGASVPNAVLTGAGGFGAAVLLMLAIVYFLDDASPR